MLKRIEVWDFESHEHAVLDSLSPGFNLIWGPSNAGKSALIRFLRLIAYNDFSPKSIRVGKKRCRGLVETERGIVEVTRGEGVNLWEITPAGGVTERFNNIGKQSLSQVAETLGLRMIKLGDIEMPVNIMDQLEGHFMLAEFAGQSASGSMRAQVLDEISGLTGLESLVKSVSLDNYRLGRDVKVLEERMEETRRAKHDESVLDAEGELLGGVGKVLSERDECATASVALAETNKDLIAAKREADAADVELHSLPNSKAIDAVVKRASGVMSKSSAAKALLSDWEAEVKTIKGMADEFNGMPPSDVIEECASRAGKRLALRNEIMELEEEISTAVLDVSVLESDINEATVGVAKASKEANDLIKSFTVCPITLKPVKPECLNS